MFDLWSFLHQTAAASMAALFVLVLQHIFRDKLSPQWQYAVWMVVVLRLILPVGWLGRSAIADLTGLGEALRTWVELGLDSAWSSPWTPSLPLAGIPIPTPVEEALADMSAIATPLGLVSLGGFFKFADTKRYLKQLIIVVAGRLVVCPAIFLPVFVSMGVRGVDLMALATMMGAPIAVSSFIMAQQQGADADLAGQAVVYTALFSIFTMFLIIFGLKQLALI